MKKLQSWIGGRRTPAVSKTPGDQKQNHGPTSSSGKSYSGIVDPPPAYTSQPDHGPATNQVGSYEQDQPDSSDSKTAVGSQLTSSAPSVTVNVIPGLDDNLTNQSSLAKGFAAMTRATYAANDTDKFSLAAGTISQPQELSEHLGELVTNVLYTLAQFPPANEPRRICAYHIYGTVTTVASFLAAKRSISLISTSPVIVTERDQLLRDFFTACVYLGMAVLAKPTTLESTALVSVIGTMIQRACTMKHSYGESWAQKVMQDAVDKGCGVSGAAEPAAAALVSTLTTKQLAGVAKSLAYATRDYVKTERAISETFTLLLKLDRACITCRFADLPVYLCGGPLGVVDENHPRNLPRLRLLGVI